MEERKNLAYNRAKNMLAIIGGHPALVAESYPGYYLDVNNIFGYTEMNPFAWYRDSDATFRDLFKKDRAKVYAVLNAFKKQKISEKEVTEACKACADLAEIFSQKIVLADALEGVGALAD